MAIHFQGAGEHWLLFSWEASRIVSYITRDNLKFAYVILSFPPGLITGNHVF